MDGPAKLITTSHPRTPFCVYYLDAERREKSGRRKRVPKWFSDRGAAEKHRDELNKRLALVGTAGLAMDAAMRADYWAGRQILDAAGHLKVSFRELAERHVEQKPGGSRSRKLLDVLPEFIADKRDEGASEQTVTNLENRLKAWWTRAHLVRIDDLTRAAALEVRKPRASLRGGTVGKENRRNDMAAGSSFCSWLANKEVPELEMNPFLGLKRPREVKRPPIFENDQAARVLREAWRYAKGRYLPAVVLMLANLRPSEVPHARIIYTGKPVVKIEGDAGKLRGRANRVVPLWPSAIEWLKKAGKPAHGIRALNLRGRRTICARAKVTWKADICRHTAISNRGAILDNDAKLAREAGTSENIIFRRYHRVRTKPQAVGFYGIRPPKRR